MAVSSRNMPITRYDNCIMMRISQGDSPSLPTKNPSIARTAPTPSKTAPKQSAARMIHMNMQLIASVLRMVASITRRVILPLNSAARVAAVAPTAELSTRLVIPIRNSPVIEKKMTRGRIPALSRRNFSPQPTRRSSAGNAGPRCG